MALIKCGECGKQVSPKASACPKCGAPPPSPEELRERTKNSILGWGMIIGIGMVLFIGNAIFGGNSPNSLAGIEQVKKPNLKRYIHSRVNVRKGPGTNFKIVNHLQVGELVNISSDEDKWAEVYRNDKRLGFVYTSLLAKNPPKVSRNEQEQLLNTKNWGDFRKARKLKLAKAKEEVFAIWKPILQYAQYTLYPRIGTWAKSPEKYIQKMHGHKNLTVKYDEVWVWEDDSAFTKEEKEQNRGQLDIYRMYWLKGKVQAHIVGKLYESNPTTGRTLSTPTHKIWQISDRKLIFKEL